MGQDLECKCQNIVTADHIVTVDHILISRSSVMTRVP
jgi:hypothetical protein